MMEKMIDTKSDTMGVVWVVAEVAGCKWMVGR